ncbi:MAG: hypothetical protein HXY25_12090 [Alphaproteobacteria bacterium]|nr:hypothetical protein [Alphaproteobacteria bacterium]
MSTQIPTVRAVRTSAKAFYAVMGLTTLAIAVLGFVPTYFAPLAKGAFAAPGIVHVHGLLFFAWMLMFCVQAWLVYVGRTQTHRAFGLAGISLATAMVCSVLMVTSAMVELRSDAGFRQAALAFTWVQVGGMSVFAGLIAAAIANVQRPETHKRLMLLATVSLLDAPIARWVIGFSGEVPTPGAPPPLAPIFTASLLADLLIVGAMAVDWRTRGRPHSAYLIGGAALLLFQITRQPIAESSAWAGIAAWMFSLGG